MESLRILFAIAFLMTSVLYVNRVVSQILSERMMLLRIVILFVTTLLCLYVVDIVIYFERPLLRVESRDKIIEMIKYLLAGMGALFFYNNQKK